MRIGEAVSPPIPSVAVESDADMRRYRTAAHLPKQSAFAEVLEDFLHWCAGDASGPILMVPAEWTICQM